MVTKTTVVLTCGSCVAMFKKGMSAERWSQLVPSFRSFTLHRIAQLTQNNSASTSFSV